MPDKTDEERERLAKKLAEQRSKIEVMPTTAKVSVVFGIISHITRLFLAMMYYSGASSYNTCIMFLFSA